MEINNHVYASNSEAFLRKVCNYLANVGSLVARIYQISITQILKHFKRFCQSFAFHEIAENEIKEGVH